MVQGANVVQEVRVVVQGVKVVADVIYGGSSILGINNL